MVAVLSPNGRSDSGERSREEDREDELALGIHSEDIICSSIITRGTNGTKNSEAVDGAHKTGYIAVGILVGRIHR